MLSFENGKIKMIYPQGNGPTYELFKDRFCAPG